MKNRNKTYTILQFVLVIFVVFTSQHVKAQTYQKGDILQLIKDIKQAMPGMNSKGFLVPTDAQIAAFEGVFNNLKNKNYQALQSELNNYQYSFIEFFDNTLSDTLYVLKEDTPVKRGWGTYIYYPKGNLDLVVECPHPLWDTNTPEFGIKFFTGVKSRYYMLAGTHRYANPDTSSDMAHETQSVFHAAHRIFVKDTSIQIHGFNKSSYKNYPDVVISNGTLYPPAIHFKIRDKYKEKGFTAGVFSLSTYDSLWMLGATTNAQGLWSNSKRKTFIHVEHDNPLRTDAAKTEKAVSALISAFSTVSAVKDQKKDFGFVLHQNYPNPFNPETNIRYSLKETSKVSIIIHDVLGREVSAPVNGVYAPGEYNLLLNAGNMFPNNKIVSGVYFYTLKIQNTVSNQVNTFSETKKMVLIK